MLRSLPPVRRASTDQARALAEALIGRVLGEEGDLRAVVPD
jgi:hypothetical protein